MTPIVPTSDMEVEATRPGNAVFGYAPGVKYEPGNMGDNEDRDPPDSGPSPFAGLGGKR